MKTQKAAAIDPTLAMTANRKLNECPMAKGFIRTASNFDSDCTKIAKEKDITKLVNYLSLYDATTLTASIQTGIMRCSICYYIGDLERLGIVGVVCRKPDPTTHRMAKYYSANPTHWARQKWVQLSLFEGEG